MTMMVLRSLTLAVGIWSLTAMGSPRVEAQPSQPFNLGTVEIQQGTVLPVTSSTSAQAQYFASDSVAPLTVVVSQAVFDANGDLLLPAGSRIYGQMQPAPGGVEFIANSLVVEGRHYSIVARSPILHDVKDPRQYASGAILGDATLGAMAGVLFGAATGGLGAANVLGGAAAGVVTGNVTANRTVVLQPGEIFQLILDAPVRL